MSLQWQFNQKQKPSSEKAKQRTEDQFQLLPQELPPNYSSVTVSGKGDESETETIPS